MVEFAQVYIDSSIVLRITLAQAGRLQARWRSAVSSELLAAEVFRTVDRLRIVGGLSENETRRLRDAAARNLAAIDLIPLDSRILRRAGGTFPTPLKTLDAIHLATALSWFESTGEGTVLLTHDRQLALGAEACGLSMYPLPD